MTAAGAPRSYLQIRNWRSYQHYPETRTSTPPWVKFYASTLEDDTLAGLDTATRLLANLLLLVAARTANQIPDSPRIVAGFVQMTTRTVTLSLRKLLQVGYLERITMTDREREVAQTGQLRLVPASTAASTPASTTRARESRQEQDQERTSNATSTSNHANATDDEPRALPGRPEPLEQLIDDSGARGTSSERTMRAIAHGKPEHVHARALESFRGRTPRPDNPIGYAIACLRAIAADTGRPTTKIAREPEGF